MCRFPSIYLFRYENMRNESFKAFREALKEHSRQESHTYLLEALFLLHRAQLDGELWCADL